MPSKKVARLVDKAKANVVDLLVSYGDLDRDEAERTIGRAVTDDQIVSQSRARGIVTAADDADEQGGILGFFRRIIDWFGNAENQEKIRRIVKFILEMVALLGPLFLAKVQKIRAVV